MPRYGTNLLNLFKKKEAKFTAESIYSLGIQLVNVLEKIHDAGYVYNDLKLDNLMLDYGKNVDKFNNSDDDIFATNNVNVIDMGFATRYMDEQNKEHVTKSMLDEFRGNILFSSLN